MVAWELAACVDEVGGRPEAFKAPVSDSFFRSVVGC